jgi:polysaccharide export outer membrane protein
MLLHSPLRCRNPIHGCPDLRFLFPAFLQLTRAGDHKRRAFGRNAQDRYGVRMPKQGLAQPKPSNRANMTRLFAVVLTIYAAGLGACGSSSNFSNLENNGSFVPMGAAQQATAEHAGLSQAVDKYTSPATPGNSAYKIGPLDVLDVAVFQVPDLKRSVQVADTGVINYPLVGEIQAAGKTAHQLELELAKKLGAKYLQSPQVTVFVKEFNSQRITVEGSVKGGTGVFPLKGRTTLIQVLAEAGDINNDIASGDIVIFRMIDGKRSAARFDFDAIQKGKAQDPELQPGDVIVVDTSPQKVALEKFLHVLPAANTAGSFVPIR